MPSLGGSSHRACGKHSRGARGGLAGWRQEIEGFRLQAVQVRLLVGPPLDCFVSPLACLVVPTWTSTTKRRDQPVGPPKRHPTLTLRGLQGVSPQTSHPPPPSRDVQVVVFDEADRLFEMGFAEQLRAILREVPDSRQTMLVSATMPSVLAEFARAGLQEPQVCVCVCLCGCVCVCARESWLGAHRSARSTARLRLAPLWGGAQVRLCPAPSKANPTPHERRGPTHDTAGGRMT